MGFGGSAAAMIQTIRANTAQLKKRKGYFEKDVSSGNVYGNFEDHKKMTPEAFEAFKQKIKKQEQDRQLRVVTIFSLIMILIIGMLIYYLY